VGPIAAPGHYTVRLNVDGQSFTQPLTVLRDPRAPGSEADIEQSVATLLRIRADISRASDSVNQIEWYRKQLEVIETMLRPARKHEAEKPAIAEDGDEPDPEPSVAPPRAMDEAETKMKRDVLAAAEGLDAKLVAIEHRLVSEALMNSDDKYFVEPYGVFLNLIWLNAEVGTGGGDVAGSADFAPTAAQMESLQSFEAELSATEAAYRTLLQELLPAFNRELDKARLAPLAGGATATGLE
jgi:hypothetical protein